MVRKNTGFKFEFHLTILSTNVATTTQQTQYLHQLSYSRIRESKRAFSDFFFGRINLGLLLPSFIFFCIPFIIFALLSPSLPVVRSSDPGSHSELFSPLPTTVRAFISYREKNSAFPSLVDSRRIVRTHAGRRFQQLIFFLHFRSSVESIIDTSFVLFLRRLV